MDGLILAAGLGSRMSGINTPKCILSIDNTTVIKYQLKCFNDIGIDKIIIVTGYKSELIKNHLGKKALYIFHEDYHKTNNLHSLWKARDFLNDDFVCVYSDLFFSNQILKKCINSKEDICLAIDRKIRDETMKVRIDNNHIIAVNKLIEHNNADGNFIGMAKFSNNGRQLLFGEIDKLIKQGNVDAYYTLALEHMINTGYKIHFVETEDLPWVDIDTIQELEKARSIYKNMHK